MNGIASSFLEQFLQESSEQGRSREPLNAGRSESSVERKTTGGMSQVSFLMILNKEVVAFLPSLHHNVVASLHHSHRSQPAEVRRVALIYSKLHHHPLCALSTLN